MKKMTDKKSLDFKRYFRNRIRRIEAFIMLILFSFNIFAEIVPDPASIGARATKTASGIDQLDITAPNKNGTSYNSLKELQVSEQGLILNNNKDIVVNTKTAGYVTRNRNLDNSIAASLIITEVTGKNKTNINGTVEVAGKRADLVMANRNGIYVNGGNFLNTDRVTLTTGSLEMKNGDLVAINVTQGQIGIGGKGIDALNLTDLELLGKTIDVSGVIKASKETRLLVSAGGQTYEYKTKEVKSKGESYKGIAIDGKAVGSMYAGKIDIISNDKGAGVNTKGDLVSVDDIVLTANGDITTAKVDSGKDLKYETTQKVKMNGKTTVAKKVKVKAKETEINAKVITGYLEKALGKKSLSIESEKTKITSKIEAYGKVEIKSDYTQNNGEISANEKINIVGNKLNNNNGEIRSQEKIAINTKETSNVKGYILSDGLTKEDVKKEENKNQKDVKDDKNKEKGIEITGDLDNREGVIRGREISLGNLTGNNKGKIDSIGALTFNGKIIVNKGGVISGNIQELNVDRLINDEGNLLSTEKINGTAKEISNKNGEILGVKTVTLVGDKLNNLSGVVRSYGKVKLNEKDVSNVEGYILSDGITKEQAQNWKVEEKAIEESKDDKNQKDVNEKKEQTTGTLLNLGRLDNTKGIIASLSQTTVNIGKIANNDGKIVSKGAVELTTPNEYEYKGLVEGDYSTKLNAKKIIINDNFDRKNTLSLISKEELTLGQSIRARILSIATQADLRNTKDISATNLLSITAKNIENSGNLYSNGNTYLEAKNGDLINKDGGSIKADKQVYIKVENGRVVNGTERYLDGAYRREDGVFVDNRQISKEKPSIIAGKTETIIKAKDFINTSLIGKAGQGITYIELAGKGVNVSIGDNIAKIEGQKVSVEGNKGVTNIGAVISGTEITRVTSKNGKVLNESTITTEELTRTVEKKKKFLRKKYTEVYGTIERIRNIGKIEGNGIIYVEGKEIENVAGNIGGAGGTLLKSTEGNIEDKTITLVDNRKDVTETYTEMREVKPKGKWWRRREAENPEPKKYEQVQLHRYWDIVNKTKTVSGVIGNGKDTILDSAKDLILESSDIRAKDNIALNAKNNLLMLSTVGTEYKFRTETSSKRSWGRKKTKTETWIEDNVYANPVELTSGGYILINYREKGKPADNKGIFAQGVNFNAKKGIIAKSDGNIYIQGVKDKLNSTYDSHTTKSFAGIKYKRTSDYVSDNREKYKHSQLYGEAGVTLDSQGRLRVQGIDIQTIGPVYLKGVKGVEILSGNEVSSRYEEHTSKNFKIGSDKVLKIEQNKNTKEIDIIKSIGSIINSKGSMVTIEGDKVVSIGSKIGAAGDINLIGKNGVIIKDGENFAKIREETEKMRTNLFASWSLKNLSASAGVEAVYNKTNDGKTMVTPEKNVIVTNKNLNIISKSGNIFMQGDFGAKEDINVKAEKGKIYIKDSKSEILTDSKSVNARMALAFGINLSGFKDTLKSYKSQLKAVKEIGNLGRVISFTRDMAKGKSLLESLDGKEDTINAMNTLFAGPSSGGVTAGLDLTGSVSAAKSTSKYLQNITTNIRAGKDIVFKSKEFETEGSFIRAENNLSIDASKILIQASADKYATNSKNMGANFGITLIGSNGVSAGLNYGQMKSKGTLYNNAQIQAGNKLIVKADDMTVRGGRLEGKYVDVDVKKNLLIESLQDSEKMKQIGANLGYSFKKEKAQDGTVSKKGDGSLGLSFGGKDKKWVKEQSGIIGTENAKVSVGGTTKLIGSIIGGKNTTLRTGKLEYSDIYDKDKGYDIGLNSKVTVSKNEDKWNISKTIGANFGARDKEQINRATIGSGTIIVGGKVVNPNINRDESIAQEITKNVNVDGISVEYKDNRRRWSDISDIMGEYGKSLGSDLDKMSGGKYNLENKLSNGISNFMFEVEKVLDHDLKNGIFGIIPTKEYTGGIVGQLQSTKKRYIDGEQELVYAELTAVMDKNGKPLLDRKGALLVDSKTKIVGPNDKIDKNVRIKPLPANGVFNSPSEAIAGAAAATFTPDEDAALRRGETIKMLVIRNKSAGAIMDTTETLVAKFGGLLGNQNWGARSMENIYRAHPELLANNNWHSQSSINGTAVFLHMGKDPEGRALLAKNVERLGLKGMAITKIGYTKLGNLLHGLNSNIDLFYMRNQREPVSFFAAWWMPANTNETGHDNNRYNTNRFELNPNTGIYEKSGPIYNYQMRMMDGKDQRSIIERWGDKRAQEKRIGGK